MTQQHTQFTKYEVARIIGARALQIAMDAPLLIKLSETELKEMKYDALQIAEREFHGDALPITIQRPIPQKRKEKLALREEKVSDEEIEQKEKEVEKEVVQDAQQLGFVAEDDTDSAELDTAAGSEEQ